MASNFTFDFTDKRLFNEVYLKMLYDDSRSKILYGGRNSGKSDFTAQAIILNILCEEFYRTMLVRRYYNSIETSQFQTIKDYIKLWELNDYFHISTRPLKIVNKLNQNNVILARGLDKEDNTKSIKDINSVWIEEANQINEEAYVTTSQSLRGTWAKKIEEWITFNPVKEKCFINQYFFPNKKSYEREDGDFTFVKSIRDDTTILHTTYKHNRFLPQSIINNLESYRLTDVNKYRVNTLGLWGGTLKGLVYEDWEIIDEIPDKGDDVYGLDYGYINPSALVQCRQHENNLFVNELLYETHLTHKDLTAKLKKDYWELLHDKIIVVDSAAPELIAEMKKSGFYAKPANKDQYSVFNGIQEVKKYNLFITRNSENVISNFESYVWKENSGNFLDVPVKMNDHACDAIRYAVYTYGKKYWSYQQENSSIRPIRRKKINNQYSNYFGA